MMKQENFKSWIAVLTAVVTVLGAAAACLASVAVSTAGDQDFAGLDAAIRAQKAEIINYVTAYQNYRAYTDYIRYEEMGYLMYDPEADAETDARNYAIQQEMWGVSSGLLASFVKARYIDPDRSYDIERELQEAFADDAQTSDLNSQPYFEKSDIERSRSAFLTADMIVFAVSFWFLTLAQATEKNVKYVWAGLGVLFAIGGIFGIIYGRFFL